MKRFARGILIGMVWLLAMLGIMMGIVKPISMRAYEKFYSSQAAQRRELYDEVETLESDFEAVYGMRNAEIINSENPVIVLKSDELTLQLSFNEERTNIIGMNEKGEVPEYIWIIATLIVTLAMYVCYSIGAYIGKCVADYTHKNERTANEESKNESYQE